MKPSDFVEENTKILARFTEDKWSTGIVAEIKERGTDLYGSYIQCAIVYEDGELIEDEILYDNSFEEESDDGWKLETENSKLIKYIYEHEIKLEFLKEAIQDDSSEEDEESLSSSKEEVKPEPIITLNVIKETALTFFLIALSTLTLSISYKTLTSN